MSKEERERAYSSDPNYSDGTYNGPDHPPPYTSVPAQQQQQPTYANQTSNFNQYDNLNQPAGTNQAGYQPQYGGQNQSAYVNQPTSFNQYNEPGQPPYQNQSIYQQQTNYQQKPNFSGPSTQPAKPAGSSIGARINDWAVRASGPINKFTNRIGSEAFWPSSLEKECDKAARILKSFCHDGFYTEQKTHHQPASSSTQSFDGPKGKAKVLVKIPQKVIQNCVGLAIFTTLRTGLHISGAGGSGVLIARLPDGSWSPPSGLLIHTLGAGLIVGLDIYDCVCVINSPAALAAFTHPRLSLGGEVSVVAGPIGAGGSLEAAVGRSAKPVYSYMKSRGLYAGLQVDGTVVVERRDENERFYGRRVGVEQILRGDVGPGSGSANGWPLGAQRLMEVVNSADGRREVNETVMRELGKDPTPGDLADGMSEDYYASGGEPMGEKKVYS